MKVFVQVIDKRTGIYQTGMIEEPVISNKEIDNALAHFGVTYGDVEWHTTYQDIDDFVKNIVSKFGEIEGTSKVVTIVAIG